MFLAANVRCDILTFAYGYSPKTPQKLGAAYKWHAPSATQTLKPALAAFDFRSGTEPYWRGLEKGFALGYRRRGRGGTWLARRRQAEGGRYAEHRIGTTDDLQDADGVAVLDYGQAQRAAREWWRAEVRREEGHDTRQGPLSIADAMADYLKAYERRGGKAAYDIRRVAETHILPALGTTTVAKLTARKIADWHHGLAEKRARVRIVDEAEVSMVSSLREATEIAFQLQEECGLTQLKIAMGIGRSQGWISKLLSWRERGYEGTPSLHVPVAPKLLPGNNPAPPDPQVGMPDGPKLALLPDNTIKVVGNTGDPVEEGKAMAEKMAALDKQGATSPASKSAPADLAALAAEKDRKSKAAYAEFEVKLDEWMDVWTTTEKLKAFDRFKLHSGMVGVKRRAA